MTFFKYKTLLIFIFFISVALADKASHLKQNIMVLKNFDNQNKPNKPSTHKYGAQQKNEPMFKLAKEKEIIGDLLVVLKKVEKAKKNRKKKCSFYCTLLKTIKSNYSRDNLANPYRIF